MGALDSLYDFQRGPVEQIVDKGAGILNWDTGLGKSFAALATIEALKGAWLVVCPAGVVSHWTRLLEERGFTQSVQVVSDAKLEAVAEEIGRWGPVYRGVVIDELHRFKTWRAKRNHFMRVIARSCKYRIGLTGTLIPNDPGDVFEQVDLIYPKAFGSVWAFREKYQVKVPDEHAHSGYVYKGVTKDGGPMLARKLDKLVSRVTKSDVAHLLTPLNLQVVDAMPELGGTHTVVLAHLRSRARALAEAQGALLVTGDLTVKQREKRIQLWREQGGRLIATMCSIQEGIDLTAAHNVAFDQLNYRPATVMQTIGRFHRLNSKEPVTIYFVVKPCSVEARIASVLKDKFDAMARSGNASSTDTMVCDSLGRYIDRTDDEVLAALMNSAPSEQRNDTMSDVLRMFAMEDDDED